MNGYRKLILALALTAPCIVLGCLPPDQAGPVPVPNPPAPQPAAPVEMETVKADVGVGAKGRSLDEYKGKSEAILAQPAITYFAAKERIAFEVAVPHALNLFNASEGRYPTDHEEFMDRIIKENQIKLPVLPVGHEYKYDPETHTLMVVRPKPAAPPQP